MATRSYRVKPNVFFGARDEYGPGAVVELDEAAALGFLDKLELVQETQPENKPVNEPAPQTPKPVQPPGRGKRK